MLLDILLSFGASRFGRVSADSVRCVVVGGWVVGLSDKCGNRQLSRERRSRLGFCRVCRITVETEKRSPLVALFTR
ncbi:MAG: hypothetical protein ACRCU2_11235 [Planktothrix sp.]